MWWSFDLSQSKAWLSHFSSPQLYWCEVPGDWPWWAQRLTDQPNQLISPPWGQTLPLSLPVVSFLLRFIYLVPREKPNDPVQSTQSDGFVVFDLCNPESFAKRQLMDFIPQNCNKKRDVFFSTNARNQTATKTVFYAYPKKPGFKSTLSFTDTKLRNTCCLNMLNCVS